MNPQLPARPGEHGAVLDTLKTFEDGTPIGHQAIPFFICYGPNDWKLQGCYTLEKCGEISEEDVPRMPLKMIETYEKKITEANWGKDWVERANNGLPPEHKIERSEEGVRAALFDGRLKFTFTILKCAEYRTEMLDRLEHFRAHPQPSKRNQKKSKKRAFKEVE